MCCAKDWDWQLKVKNNGRAQASYPASRGFFFLASLLACTKSFASLVFHIDDLSKRLARKKPPLAGYFLRDLLPSDQFRRVLTRECCLPGDFQT